MPGAGQGVDPGVAREEARGHVSANLLVFSGGVVFGVMQVQPHLLCSDDLKAASNSFFLLSSIGKDPCCSRNSPYQCFHHAALHPVGELNCTERSSSFYIHKPFQTQRAQTGS